MKNSNTIFRIQYKLFLCDKGILVFYFLLVLIMGFIIPIFYKGMSPIISFIALMTIMLTKPILADSLASEREHKTLESILSAPLMVKHIIWGKIGFSLFFSVLFFSLTTVLMILTFRFCEYQIYLIGWQWICIFMGIVLNLTAICITGVYRSAFSESSYIANSKISKIIYSLIFLQIVYFSIIFQADFLNDAEKTKKNTKRGNAKFHLSPKSQFETVLRHEFKYFLKQKTLLINFMILCACPALVVCILKYYFGTVNLYYAVILTALMMPRTPTNLIAYSIGGEKAYKTGEFLLSTPVHIMPLFLAKSMIPVFISTIMLIISSLLTLAGANIIGIIFEFGKTYLYTNDQWILLFPIGIMSCITMVFITGIFSIYMKTPRQGLYISSIVGTVFVIPLFMIIYLPQNPFMWSVIYFIVLLLINMVSLKGIAHKINRPLIIEKL